MLIKNTYELSLGQLYTFFIAGEKTLVIPFITPLAENSFVSIKNGKSEGSKIFAQTSTPLYATFEYFAGFIAINIIIINIAKPKKS